MRNPKPSPYKDALSSEARRYIREMSKEVLEILDKPHKITAGGLELIPRDTEILFLDELDFYN